MAAGQQKKRLSASSAVSHNLHQCSAKKKKIMESSDSLSDVSSYASLEWDGKQKRVATNTEQIGITWSSLLPFMDSFPKQHTGLADAIAVPQEIFCLEDMTAVLTYEVWKKHLSESEKKFLSSFLPKGTDSEDMVQRLLSGENLNFGNPSDKWGSSLCAGNLHPDAVLSQERRIKANKKTYYQELHKYHNGMMGNLQMWKELYSSCEDPEKDFPDQILRKRLMRDRFKNVPERARVGTKFAKEENTLSVCVQSGDVDKYMSYFKVSKKQHGLVKRIKQSGDGIHSKSVSSVLGDIKFFHVQPYEAFETEEDKRLHEHWLHMTKIDLPSAFARWTERKSQRQKWKISLEQEMAEKKKNLVIDVSPVPVLHDDKIAHSNSLLEEQRDDGEIYHEVTEDIENYEEEVDYPARTVESQPLQRVPLLNGHYELEHTNRGPEMGNRDISGRKVSSLALHMNTFEDDCEEGVPISYISVKNDQALQRIPSLNSHQDPNEGKGMEMETDQDIIRAGEAASNLSKVQGDTEFAKNSVGWGGSVSSAQDLWPATGMIGSYHRGPMPICHGYTSADLALTQPKPIIRHRPAEFVDVEAETFKNNVERPFFQTTPCHDIGSDQRTSRGFSDLGSYRNPDIDNIQSFVQGEMVPQSYSLPPKQLLGVQLLETRNRSVGIGNSHPGHFREQQRHTLEQRQQISERELYMNKVSNKNMFSDGGIYHSPMIPSRQRLLPQTDTQIWNPVHVSTPSQSLLSNGQFLAGKGWSSVHDGWSGVGVSGIPGQCVGNGRPNENLYSAVSDHSTSQYFQYDGVIAEQQGVPGRGFVGGPTSRTSNFPTQTGQQVNHFSGHEAVSLAPAASNLNTNSTPRMNFAHQPYGMHDSFQKSFLR